VAGTGARLLNPWSPEQHVQVMDFFEHGGLHQEKVRWQAVPAELLRADALILVPIFKHHRAVRVAGAVMRPLGLVWRRAVYQQVGFAECIAELAAILRPTLVVMDATRFLTSNGPEGPGETTEEDRILVSADPLLADAYACRWLDVEPPRVRYLDRASELKVGQIDVSKARVEKVSM